MIIWKNPAFMRVLLVISLARPKGFEPLTF